jgi:hypothetical protein
MSLSTFTTASKRIRVGRQNVAKEISEEELAEPTACLGRAEGLLEAAEIAHTLVELYGRRVQLPEFLGQLGRGATRALLLGEQAAIETVESAIDLRLDVAEAAIELLLHPAQTLLEHGAAGAREPHEGSAREAEEKEGDDDAGHGPTNVREGIGQRPLSGGRLPAYMSD